MLQMLLTPITRSIRHEYIILLRIPETNIYDLIYWAPKQNKLLIMHFSVIHVTIDSYYRITYMLNIWDQNVYI